MTDVFNNTSNDYINPTLATCPGVSDEYAFEFLPKRLLGVVSGNDTLMSLDFADFSQPVTQWSQDKKLLQSGEVVFISGLTKGVSNEQEVLLFTSEPSSYYVSVDLSIGYYKNFKYTTIDVSANGDLTANVDIADALNITLGNKGVGVTVDVDASGFIFTGSGVGYAFDVTNLNVAYDGSTFILNEDLNRHINATRYPNGAMLGYVLKLTFPNSVTDENYKYLNLNHIPTTFSYYEASTGSGYVKYTKTVDAGMNGASNSTTMSAGDYLNYITENTGWEKVGRFRAWISASDPDNDNQENLITGFYLYNPQTFSIQVEYMVIL